MTIAAKAPRGGLAEELAGASRVMVLRNAEIERFEDHRRGIFAIWDGFFGRGAKPTAGEVRDLIALGLVGGGMADKAADALVAGLGPGENARLYTLAQALVGVAFVPEAEDLADAAAEAEAEPEPGPGDLKKKTAPAPGA